MKNITKILILIFIITGSMSSCDYLNVDDYFEDTFKEDSVFASKRNIQRYFNGTVAMLPHEGKIPLFH